MLGNKNKHSTEAGGPKFIGKLVYIKVHSHLSFTHYLTKPLVFELLSRELDNKTPLVMEKFRLTMVGFFGHKLKLG